MAIVQIQNDLTKVVLRYNKSCYAEDSEWPTLISEHTCTGGHCPKPTCGETFDQIMPKVPVPVSSILPEPRGPIHKTQRENNKFNFLWKILTSQSGAVVKVCRSLWNARNNVSFIHNPLPPPETNGNRKTGLTFQESECGLWLSRAWQKETVHSRVVGKQQNVEKWKITTHAEEESKSVEGEKVGKVTQNNGVK